MPAPWALALASAVAIAPVRDRPPPPQAIYGGQRVEPGAWPAVVGVQVVDILCTGTLIAPNLVLTAAHCLSTAPAAAKVKVLFGDETPLPTWETVALAYAIHPDYCGDDESCAADRFDFAWVTLSEPAPAAFPPAKILSTQEEWDALMSLGAPTTFVGFGINEHLLQGIKREAETTITGLSPTGLEFRAGSMGVDSCQGDSGGPAFVPSADGPLLAGVLSRGYACGNGGFYGVAYTALCWVSESSGVGVRPAGCSECDCLDTDPTPARGCDRCAARGGGDDPTLALLLPLVALARPRRRHVPRDRNSTAQYQRSESPRPAPLTRRGPSKISIPS